MDIDIKYNDELDEFIYDLSLEMRLKNYINNHFYPAYVIAMLAPIYLVGGFIRDLIYAKKPKDMDFVVLGKEQLTWVLMIFDTYNIKFTLKQQKSHSREFIRELDFSLFSFLDLFRKNYLLL